GLGDIEFAYCTEFMITNMYKTTTMASIDSLRDRLMTMGDSVVCVGDLEMVKVHVHTNTPGIAITAALNLGEMTKLKVDNMLEQNREMRKANKIEDKDQGIVVVAAGEGLINVFKDLGVDYVIKGGQTMNPSAEDIAEAVRRVHAKNVYVFPNNSNILLAAKHAQSLSKKNIIVIPTKTVNEGVSACIMFDPDASIEENTEQFLSAMGSVKSGSVTYASRNTKMNRFEIKEGEIIGLDNKTILAKGNTPKVVATTLITKMMSDDITNVTMFYGADVREKDAMGLQDELMKKFPQCEINVIMGGQPIYYYLISLE
ncbi:MAG: DAK2 domain-containing protein, partial [Firmicutes bacterium]|nr:DAK2 domain-containing protein [Bacillota bacterium]